MTTLAPGLPSGALGPDQRLRRLLRLHFDPDLGAPYWIDRAAALGVDPRREVRDLAGLSVLGEMTPADLAGRPLRDFIPRRFHEELGGFVTGQTGGTTGGGVWTAYRPDEFDLAFLAPFEHAARHVGFPRGERWLFVGPSGPHIIGKVVRELAARQGSHDPFSVDFDARWAKKLPDGSLALDRYLSHIVEQAMAVVSAQETGVLFTTPAVLGALAQAMTPAQRARVRGVHYGGMELPAATLERFQREVFPGAVHLSGYGNTLFGCCLELRLELGRLPAYFPFGRRLVLEVVDASGAVVPPGGTGRVRFTRLDETTLIVRMLERDAATAAVPPADAPAGFSAPGVGNPHSPAALAPHQAKGLY